MEIPWAMNFHGENGWENMEIHGKISSIDGKIHGNSIGNIIYCSLRFTWENGNFHGKLMGKFMDTHGFSFHHFPNHSQSMGHVTIFISNFKKWPGFAGEKNVIFRVQ